LAPQLGKNNQMMIKVSDTLVAAFGASNPADFASKLEGVLAELPGLKNKIEEVSASSESIRSKLDEIDAKATENESIADLLNAHTLTQDSAFAASVRNIAATAGSQVASEALAKTGTNPVAPSLPVQNENPAALATANEDWKNLWALDPNIKNEFVSAEVFDAYKRAEQAGRVKTTANR
jgi:hypothetical protein